MRKSSSGTKLLADVFLRVFHHHPRRIPVLHIQHLLSEILIFSPLTAFRDEDFINPKEVFRELVPQKDCNTQIARKLLPTQPKSLP
jgi:hypothetical protein